MSLAGRFLRDEAGQDGIEFALLLGLVAVAGIALLPSLAGAVRVLGERVTRHLDAAAHFLK
jgi:Flp pilus assembly pilin Flp